MTTPLPSGPEPRSPSRRSIDVIIPAYDEEDCIPELARRLALLFDLESSYQWRTIVVENGSTDRSWELLQEVCATDPRFTVVRLSRNFHMDGGLTAGLEYATADAVVFMTADLQDPPEAISEFLRRWEAGAHNVYGLVTEREGTGRLRRFNSQLFYWVANRTHLGPRMPRNASDFRLMDRSLYETLRRLEQRNRFMRRSRRLGRLRVGRGARRQAAPVRGLVQGAQPSRGGDGDARDLRPHLPPPSRHHRAWRVAFSAAAAIAFVVLGVIFRGDPRVSPSPASEASSRSGSSGSACSP